MSSYFENERNEVIELLPGQYSSVLEIGCAQGKFLSALNSEAEKWGVEPNGEAAEQARSKIANVLTGTYDQVKEQIPNNHFDLIICNDVIEHLSDHDEFLKDIKTKMKSGGVIVGSIPNVRFFPHLVKLLLLKDWKYVDSGILDSTHLRFFTEKSLKRTFSDNNYTIENFKGLNSLFGAGFGVKNLVFIFIAMLITVLSLGTHKDILYTQFGFRVKA